MAMRAISAGPAPPSPFARGPRWQVTTGVTRPKRTRAYCRDRGSRGNSGSPSTALVAERVGRVVSIRARPDQRPRVAAGGGHPDLLPLQERPQPDALETAQVGIA